MITWRVVRQLNNVLLKCQLTHMFYPSNSYLFSVIVMVTLEEENINQKYLSVFRHTIAQQINVELEQDYQFPRAICRSITDLFTSYLDIYFGGQRNPNQIVFNCIAFTVPPGVPSKEATTIPVKLTVLDSDDIKVASLKGIHELIKFKIIRIVEEAYEQGGALTQADISIILGISPRSVVRYILCITHIFSWIA